MYWKHGGTLIIKIAIKFSKQNVPIIANDIVFILQLWNDKNSLGSHGQEIKLQYSYTWIMQSLT